jgi:CheY-like chemotaxis protein/putative methionine-R-sulfoxide reductase with GAF domain
METSTQASAGEPPGLPAGAEVVHVQTLAAALELLRAQHFDAFFADTRDTVLWDRAANLVQAESILRTLPDGVAVVTPDLRITWANPAFESWCGVPVRGRGFYEALGSPEILGSDYSPFHTCLSGKKATTRLHCRDNRYLDLHITPIHDADGKVTQLMSWSRDVTCEVNQQQKLTALHKAGQELAALDADQLAEMSVAERIELLKCNIRRFTHDLLHYDVVEVRLLDRRTGRLEPLLEEGMSPEAVGRPLYAKPEGNGVTGFVAAVGKSYLCPDTSADPLYIQGAEGARSSLTVPILAQDQVIGTFNVESPQLDAFNEDDQQFLEIFSREIAAALHTLELLSAEKRSTASQSVEAISREVALPVDEILTATTALLDRYIGHEPEMADKLHHIIKSARALKQCIQKVGEDLAPSAAPARAGTPTPTRLKGLRVLVADNDERVRRSAHAILGRFGCIVETARDGREAITMAKLSSYDVILADIRLPDLSGYEAYSRLRQAQPEARVILMTTYGYDPSHAIVKARQEGLRSVLYKPFRIDQLLEALDNPDGRPAPASASLVRGAQG